MDRLACLEAFVRVAESGTFSAAAIALRLPKSAVSRAAATSRSNSPAAPCAYPPVCNSTISAPIAAEARSCTGSGSTNIETRIPAAFNRPTIPRSATSCPTTSRPPSVVTSVRFSGTMQHACGRTASAISTISSVAAISKLSGLSIPAFMAGTSASRICRRSSRKWIVIPSAPAAIASSAAATGSGYASPRALRSVAT